MPIASVTGSVRRRALVVALLVVGLVAMHHLVTTGCAIALGGHTAHTSHASQTATTSSAVDHAAHAVDSAAHGSSAGVSVSDVPPGAVAQSDTHIEPGVAPVESGHGDTTGGALAAICLAIVMLLLVVRRPNAFRISRPHSLRAAVLSPPMAHALPAHPPDLAALSISRT